MNAQLYAFQTGVDKYAVFSLTVHAPLASVCPFKLFTPISNPVFQMAEPHQR